MRSLIVLSLLLAGCGDTGSRAAPAPASSCRQQMFEGSRFTVCAERGGRIEVRTFGARGTPLRGFVALEKALGRRASAVAFAMNAGMYDEAGRPIGLLVENGRQVKSINRRRGPGNFHLMPNGVFLVRSSGKAEVVTSADYKPSKDVLYATQSGPMLVINGKLHPKFDRDGESRHIRNGVGIAPDGTTLFVISEDFVSLGKFARFYRDALKSRNALFFDGAVSSLWDPANGRRDINAELGPLVVVFKAAPHPERPPTRRP